MKVSLIAFDDFTDIDLFLPWDLFSRLDRRHCSVRILGEAEGHTSTGGLRVPVHGPLREARESDVVLFASGRGTRRKLADRAFLGSFDLEPSRQLIGSQCSGALILARLGLLRDAPATTHRNAQQELRALGVTVVDAPLVVNGNVATAGGCLAAQYLVGWVLERTLGTAARRSILASVAPVGEEEEQEARIAKVLREALRAAEDCRRSRVGEGDLGTRGIRSESSSR